MRVRVRVRFMVKVRVRVRVRIREGYTNSLKTHLTTHLSLVSVGITVME